MKQLQILFNVDISNNLKNSPLGDVFCIKKTSEQNYLEAIRWSSIFQKIKPGYLELKPKFYGTMAWFQNCCRDAFLTCEFCSRNVNYLVFWLKGPDPTCEWLQY